MHYVHFYNNESVLSIFHTQNQIVTIIFSLFKCQVTELRPHRPPAQSQAPGASGGKLEVPLVSLTFQCSLELELGERGGVAWHAQDPANRGCPYAITPGATLYSHSNDQPSPTCFKSPTSRNI